MEPTKEVEIKKAKPEVVELTKVLIGKRVRMGNDETGEDVTFIVNRAKACVNRPCFILNNVWVFTQEEVVEILTASED